MNRRSNRQEGLLRRAGNTPNTRSEIAEIPGLSRADLAEIWAKIYGHPSPKGLGRRLLEYAAAYNLQSREQGEMKPETRRKLRQLVVSGEGAARQSSRAPKAKALAPGSRLVREWRGRIYTADVLENGVLYNGQRYASLSELARAITGARWSGPRFFGL